MVIHDARSGVAAKPRPRLTIFALLITLMSAVASAPVQARPDPRFSPTAEAERQQWEGTIELPSAKMEFVVTFTRNRSEENWQATIDIPIQGVADLPLQNVRCTNRELTFAIAPPANAEFAAEIDADDPTLAHGTLKQVGMEFPIRLQRVAEGEKPKIGGFNRPQTPKPPFPYEARDVEFGNEDAGITIAGTLTIPSGEGPHPAVILITGSGAQDRDETLLGHKPFAVIADYLTRRGIAVLRCDDRGVGGTGGSLGNSTSADFADDALAGLNYLASLAEIDGSRIGLMGHSEGGIVAPIAAAKSDRIAFIVLLAGTGINGREILIRQLRDILKANGMADAMIDKQSVAQRRFLDLIVDETATEEEIVESLRALSILQLAPLFADNPERMPDQLRRVIDEQIAATVPGYQSAWFQSFLTHEPAEVLRQVRCPVLAVNGSLDLQVAADVNLAAIERALTEGGNDQVETHVFEGLNHLFQRCKTGSPNEYVAIEHTFDEDALARITSWIRRIVGLD